jgi:hypothetical protein
MLWAAKQVTPQLLEECKRNPALIQQLLDEAAAGAGALNLDKAWNGVHWLLTGNIAPGDTPASRIIYGGTEIGEDIGYGPARYLSPQEVREAASELSKMAQESMIHRYNPQEMDEAGVYPSGWADDPKESLAWLLESYQRLVPYFLDAAAKGNAMLTFLF